MARLILENKDAREIMIKVNKCLSDRNIPYRFISGKRFLVNEYRLVKKDMVFE